MNNVTELLTAYETAVKLNCELTKQDIALSNEIADLKRDISDAETKLLLARSEICDIAAKNSALIKLIADSTKVLDISNRLAQDSIHHKSQDKNELRTTYNTTNSELSRLVARKSEVMKMNELLNGSCIENTNQK